MAATILATADLHLGKTFATYGSLGPHLAEERFLALERLVDAAGAAGADLLIVAGDLFDRRTIARKDIRRAAVCLSSFSGVAVVVVPGNHDYVLTEEDSLWDAFLAEAGSSLVFFPRPGERIIETESGPLRILGVPCDSAHGARHRLGDLPGAGTALAGAAGDREGPVPIATILVAHGSIEGLTPDKDGLYFPMTLSDIGAVGADLAVVGHTHVPTVDEARGLVVPGTHSPDGFDCRHEGGATLVRLSGSRIRAERVGVSSLRFLEHRHRVSEAGDADRVRDALAAAAGPETLLRVRLSGSLPEDSRRRLLGELAGLAGAFLLLEVHSIDLRVVPSAAQIDEEFAARSFAHRLLRQLADSGDEEALVVAYELVRAARSALAGGFS